MPVEPDPRTYNIDPKRIAARLTSRTKVILPVHLYGQPADLDPILALARQHGLAVVEDGAQAHGASYHGRRAHGDMVCWSFYPGKNLGALGDAGAITTNRADLADRVRVLRNYGSRVKYINEVAGVNSRLDPLQGAVLRVKLAHLDRWNARRKQIAAYYRELLSDLDLVLPATIDGGEHVWHLYVVRSPKRDAIQAALTAAGIGTLIHYPIPPHRQAAYSGLGIPGDAFPIANQLAGEVLSLPMGSHLTRSDVERVAIELKKVIAR